MGAQRLLPGLTMIAMGAVNAYLIEGDDGLVLVDAGLQRDAGRIATAIRSAGRDPSAVRQVLVTHYHCDHVGGLAAVARLTGAAVHAHRQDAGVIRTGAAPPRATPRTLLARLAMLTFRAGGSDPAPVHRELDGGEDLPYAGGIRVIDTRGHTPGHVSFLWSAHGGVLLAGDAAANMFGRLGSAFVDEDPGMADESLARLATLDFDVAVFGHGGPILGRAAESFRAVSRRLAARPSRRREPRTRSRGPRTQARESPLG